MRRLLQSPRPPNRRTPALQQPRARRSLRRAPLPGLPTEPVGAWETDLRDYLDEEDICIPCGPEVTFVIRADGSWTVARPGGAASGRLTIDDGQIVFGPSTACEGSGAYEWQSDGDTLTLAAVEADECERRQEALDGPSYTRTG